MAYKFQLGEAKLSGSITQTDGSGDLRATTVDSLDVSTGGISNAGAIAGATSIDGNGDLTMGTITMTGFSVDSSGNAAVAYLSASSYVSASALDIENGAQIGGDVLSNGKVYGVTMAAGNSEEFTVSSAGAVSTSANISSSADVKAAQLYIQDIVVIDNVADVYVNNINGNGTLSLNDGANTVSNTELLILSGATVTTAELNILDNADPSINSLSLPDNTTITTFAASILDDADEATFKATVNLEIGTDVQAYDADLDTLSGMQSGAPAALALLTSAEIALLDGASSSNNTASKAVVLDGSGNLTLDGDLIVLGSTFSASVGTLLIEDALINIGDGQASYADGYGIEFGTSGSSWASLKTAQVNSANHLSSSLPLAASSFYGDGSNLTNVSATGLEETVQSISSAGAINMNSGLQILVDVSAGGFTLTLPSAGSVEGKILKIKKKNNSTNVLTLDTASGNIDGASSIQLESGFAAVNIISDGTDFYVI